MDDSYDCFWSQNHRFQPLGQAHLLKRTTSAWTPQVEDASEYIAFCGERGFNYGLGSSPEHLGTVGEARVLGIPLCESCVGMPTTAVE